MTTKRKRFRQEEDKNLDLYLSEIGEYELLQPEQERVLAQRIHSGDEDALWELVNANLRFVVSVAKQYQNQGLPLVDMINDGNMGLIKAAKRFDETRGFKFISYAVWWIRQAILAGLAENSRVVRLPLNRIGTLHKINRTAEKLKQKYEREPTDAEIASAMDIGVKEVDMTIVSSRQHASLDAPIKTDEDEQAIASLKDNHNNDPDSKLFRKLLKEELEKVLGTLKPREEEVIRRNFGVGFEKDFTLEEIGKMFSLTRERVRQIKNNAIRRLRHISRSKRLRDYHYEQ